MLYCCQGQHAKHCVYLLAATKCFKRWKPWILSAESGKESL